MSLSPLLTELVDALTCLPGVGKKSAQRMAIQLINRQRDSARTLAQSLVAAVERVERCQSCRNLTEEPVCSVCADQKRDDQLLCIVESPMDVIAIESSGQYRGKYFVLYGHLSPIDGVGPTELGLGLLSALLQQRQPSEIILATNLTVEGEATAHFIAEMAKQQDIAVSRIAHGVPSGGELEYVDGQTLGYAISGRKHY